MKTKNLTVMTFMSWENEFEKGLRAIALCDINGFFSEAINCVRDSQMGKKDDNGVYERIWYGDNIECYGSETKTLRPATRDEVDLYLRYVSIEEAVGESFDSTYYKPLYVLVGEYYSCVIVECKHAPWYKRLWDRIRGNKEPF